MVVRVFLDDFSTAVTRRVPTPGVPIPMPPDSAVALPRGDRAVDGRRRPVSAAGPRAARLTMRVLFDRWDDQVTIIQCAYGARRQTLLFTKREGSTAKPV